MWPAPRLPRAGLAVLAHLLFDFGWTLGATCRHGAGADRPGGRLLGTGRREIGGRSGTILEGESGANDPVGIALMIGLLGANGGGAHAIVHGAAEFLLQIAMGAAVGLLGGLGCAR